jgi:Holliday junction resolvase-like predicted endonuclease
MENSKKIGDRFEDMVLKDLYDKDFDFISRNIYMPRTGCEVDFVANKIEGNVTWHVEAKGGYKGKKRRPGAQRTDNVKKAIANAALIKAEHPNVHYVVYFSAIPKRGSYSEKMINAALKHKMLDDAIYITQEELKDEI